MSNSDQNTAGTPAEDTTDTMELFTDVGWGSPLRVTLVDDPTDPTRQQIVLSVTRMSGHGVIHSLHQSLRKLIRMQ
jgi:hypothetical protein